METKIAILCTLAVILCLLIVCAIGISIIFTIDFIFGDYQVYAWIAYVLIMIYTVFKQFKK